MKTVLVTGATSFVGLELTDRLMSDGMDVHAIVRPTSDISLFDQLPSPPNCHVHDASGGNLEEIMAEVAPDTVFHLAGHYIKEHTADDVADIVRDNIEFGAQILDAMSRTEGRRLVSTGSYFQFSGTDGAQPYNLYAAAKSAFQGIVDFYRRGFGLQATTLILFDAYGPRDWRPKLMSAILDALENETVLPVPEDDPAMDLVFGPDAADAFVTAGRLLEESYDTVDGATFAVTSGQVKRISEIIAMFETAAGKAIQTQAGGWPAPKNPLPDLWNGPPVPGWKAATPLEEGIRRLMRGRS